MGISEFTFFVMVIFLSGIVAYKTVDKLTVHKKYKTHDIIISWFIYGFFSYLLYYIFFSSISSIIEWQFNFYLFETMENQNKIYYGEIVWVSIFGLIVGILVTLEDTHKVLHRIAKRVHLIYKHGDLDTFTFLMRSNIGKEPWAIVRDMEADRAYAGWIADYSIGEEQNELFLRDVVTFYKFQC